MIKVEGSKFYLYELTDTSKNDNTKAYSEWSVSATAIVDKSGLCDPATGIFSACGESKIERILADTCVGNTIGTLKIKKTTTPSTTQGDADIVTYSFVESITTGDLEGYTTSALGDSDSTCI